MIFNLKAQLKVGDNPSQINTNSILELESTNKGLLLPRLSLLDTMNPAPLSTHIKGMFVYNTNANTIVDSGIYFNDGKRWIRLLNEKNGLSNVIENNMCIPKNKVELMD